MYSSLKVEAKNLKRTTWEQSCLRSKSRSVIEGRALITADIKSLRPLGKPLREEQIFWKLEDVHFSCLASNLSWLLYDMWCDEVFKSYWAIIKAAFVKGLLVNN